MSREMTQRQRDLLELSRAADGVTTHSAARAHGVTHQTMWHHLERMAVRGVLTRAKVKGDPCAHYFAEAAAAQEWLTRQQALRAKPARPLAPVERVAQLIAQPGGMLVVDLCALLALEAPAVRAKLESLAHKARAVSVMVPGSAPTRRYFGSQADADAWSATEGARLRMAAEAAHKARRKGWDQAKRERLAAKRESARKAVRKALQPASVGVVTIAPPAAVQASGEADCSRAVITRRPGWTHDARYQCAPGERPFGAGFAAAGVGRDVATGRGWV